MKKSDIEQKLRTAVEHAAPDLKNSVLSSCDSFNQKKGDITMSENTRKNNPKRTILTAAAAIAAVFIAAFAGFGLWQNAQNAANSIVMLDVNPSLSLTVNAKERVVSAEALNDDAREILDDMDLTGTTLEVSLNAIIGSMLQKGYLNDLQNSVLVSVADPDAAHEQQLQQKISQMIANAVSFGSVDAAVLSQPVNTDDASLQQLAKQYQISVGKAALISEVIAQNPTLTFDSLSPMTINEIALIASSKNGSGDAVLQTGTTSDKAYIGEQKALEAACKAAGISTADAKNVEIEFDSDHGVMVYEIEFTANGKEYEFEIDAILGSVSSMETPQLDRDDAYDDDHDYYDDDADITASATPDAENEQSDSGSQTAYIGNTAAKNAALNHAGCKENAVTELRCEIDYENGKAQYYEVEFTAGGCDYDYQIDLYSGKVLHCEKDVDDDHHDSHHSSQTQTSTADIGKNAALSAALKHAGVSESALTEKQIELDDEDGTAVYEVEFKVGRTEYHYEIDAKTGAVLDFEKEIDD